jgi:hypothetical protein
MLADILIFIPVWLYWTGTVFVLSRSYYVFKQGEPLEGFKENFSYWKQCFIWALFWPLIFSTLPDKIYGEDRRP